MAILAECPFCHRRHAVKNPACAGCGRDLAKERRGGRVRYWVNFRDQDGKQRNVSLSRWKDVNPYSIEEYLRGQVVIINPRRLDSYDLTPMR